MDADRKLYTFKNWYTKMYKQKDGIIWNLFNFDDLKLYNGHYVEPKNNVDISKFKDKESELSSFLKINAELSEKRNSISLAYLPFRLSGDADYEIMKTDEKEKTEKMHSLPNFSLIPVTGALNNIKGRKPLPQFLEEKIEPYFNTRNIEDVPYRKMRMPKNITEEIREDVINLEKRALKTFFDMFNSFDEYCEEVYFLKKEEIYEVNADLYVKRRLELAKEWGIEEAILYYDINLDKFE